MAKLTASNEMDSDAFGYSVAVHGNYILVGAIWMKKKDGTLGAGSAYLFGNPSNDPNTPEWTQLIQFQPDDLVQANWFGHSLAMDDNIVIVGTYYLLSYRDSNAAYVFAPVNNDKTGDAFSSLSTSWTQSAKLTGSKSSRFGCSVAVAGNWIFVSACDDNNVNGSKAGAVLVFTKTVSSQSLWTQMAQLLAADGVADDHFGKSVSVSKDGRLWVQIPMIRTPA
jgi:hypothetical protein